MAAGDAFRRILDRGRSIASRFGLRPFSVFVRVTTWSGAETGDGTATIVDTQLLVGGQNPKVSEVSSEDIVASGGLYQAGDFRIGPLTPPFPGGGVDYRTTEPAVVGGPAEVRYVLKGLDFPPTGALCKKIDDDTTSALHHFVIVRAIGEAG